MRGGLGLVNNDQYSLNITVTNNGVCSYADSYHYQNCDSLSKKIISVQMVKTTQIWCKNVQNNFFKILTPLPSFQSRGSKRSKIWKSTFFQQNQFMERERSILALFYFIFRKRNIWAWHSAKNIMGYGGWKIFYRAF